MVLMAREGKGERKRTKKLRQRGRKYKIYRKNRELNL